MTIEENELKDYEEGHNLLTKVLAEIEIAKKDGVNPHFRSKYATLEACNGVVKPAVNKYGLALNHRCSSDSVITIIRYKGVDLDQSCIKLIDATNMQKLGSAITYAKRYNIGMLFNLDTEDDDANQAVGLPNNNTSVSRPANQDRPVSEGQKKAIVSIMQQRPGVPVPKLNTFQQASEWIGKNKTW